ncbi:hypothetical protein [Shewanella chilikensis]|uniref:hypothetical protein n=1 Tax=Shewanella chilikensis TaxID=558541 RepID=UPI003999AE2D
MTEAQSDTPSEKKKYRYTKQLIRIALDNGYTNADIAVKAGLSPKSIGQVSRWRSGESLATERQMRALVKEFGHLLKRKIEHLLYGFDENGNLIFSSIEGEVVFKHTIKLTRQQKSVSLYRIMLFKNSDKFTLIYQDRLGLEAGTSLKYLGNSDNEDANWLTKEIVLPDTPNAVVTSLEKYSKQLVSKAHYNDETNLKINEAILAFKARQALMKIGCPSEDIHSIDLQTQTSNNIQTQ